MPGFWCDNRDVRSMPASLHDKLERWKHRVPDFMDVDPNHDIFGAANWQYVLYGMDFRTDLSARAGTFRFHEEARSAFADIRAQQAVALARLPAHRSLLTTMATGPIQRDTGERRV